MALHLAQTLLDSIARHAAASMPQECCGLLLGELRGPDAVVRGVVPTANVSPHDRTRRYQADPQAVFAAFRDAARRDTQVVGFYHSHVGVPPEPSATDAGEAWPDMRYLIVSIMPGGPADARCWYSVRPDPGAPARMQAERLIRREPAP